VIVSDAGKPFAIDELDNYATHKHLKVLAWLARHPRWTFHFTPTSASWLNAVKRDPGCSSAAEHANSVRCDPAFPGTLAGCFLTRPELLRINSAAVEDNMETAVG
jgi:hypothetical protein